MQKSRSSCREVSTEEGKEGDCVEKSGFNSAQMETAVGICVHPLEFVVIDVKLTGFTCIFMYHEIHLDV